MSIVLSLEQKQESPKSRGYEPGEKESHSAVETHKETGPQQQEAQAGAGGLTSKPSCAANSTVTCCSESSLKSEK